MFGQVKENTATCFQPMFRYSTLFQSAVQTLESDFFISVINQLDAQNICFTVSLFHASTCFEQMCSSSGGQNSITQPLVSSHL